MTDVMDTNITCQFCRKKCCIVIDGTDAASIISSLFDLKIKDPFVVCIECDYLLSNVAAFWKSLLRIDSPIACNISTVECITCSGTRTFKQDRESKIVTFLVAHAKHIDIVDLSTKTVNLCGNCMFTMETWERYEKLARQYGAVQPVLSTNLNLRKVPIIVVQKLCESINVSPLTDNGRKRGGTMNTRSSVVTTVAKRSKPQEVLSVMLTKKEEHVTKNKRRNLDGKAKLEVKHDFSLRPLKVLLKRLDPIKLNANNQPEEYIGLEETDIVQLQHNQRTTVPTSVGARSILVTQRTERLKRLRKAKNRK